MLLRDDEILPPVVVIIEKASAPAGMHLRHSSDSGGIGGVAEGAAPVVVIQRILLVREIGYKHVGKLIVVVIREVDSHAGVSVAIAINRDFGNQSDFLEGSIFL